MKNKYSVFIKSVIVMLLMTILVVGFKGYYELNMSEVITTAVNDVSIGSIMNVFSIWGQYFTLINLINNLFLVSLLFFCIYCFKWIIDQGAFYTFQYSWQKSKKYLLFFLPKYWGSSKSTVDPNEDEIDLETGQKIYKSFEEFVDYKQSMRWHDLNQLFMSSIVLVVFCIIVSFILVA